MLERVLAEPKANIITVIFQPFACFKRNRRQNHCVRSIVSLLLEFVGHLVPILPLHTPFTQSVPGINSCNYV